MKYAWCSDIHLDCLRSDDDIVNFGESLVKDDPSGIFITGDISVSTSLVYHLSVLERVCQRPIMYILGNHDYWYGSVKDVQKSLIELGNVAAYLRYMPSVNYVSLSKETALVGSDGFYDAEIGDWKMSSMVLNDWRRIEEFKAANGAKGLIVDVAKKLAYDSAVQMRAAIKAAVKQHKNVVVLTHVPPFKEAHQYNGRTGDAYAQPWYTNKTCGDVLIDAARVFKNVNFTVLCGHTHSRWSGKVADNLTVHVAHAEYGTPQLQSLIDVA